MSTTQQEKIKSTKEVIAKLAEALELSQKYLRELEGEQKQTA